RLCRYVLRPPVAQDRLSLTPDGLVLVTLKSEWHDGTSHLLFTPVELLEKLAALTPRPRVNLVLYHAILAPPAQARADAVAPRPSAGPCPSRALGPLPRRPRLTGRLCTALARVCLSPADERLARSPPSLPTRQFS